MTIPKLTETQKEQVLSGAPASGRTIKITNEVRRLLGQLDPLVQLWHARVRRLAEEGRDASPLAVLDMQRDKGAAERMVFSLALQINEHATGRARAIKGSRRTTSRPRQDGGALLIHSLGGLFPQKS